MKLIQSRFCRRRYKIQTRFKKWFWNKKRIKSENIATGLPNKYSKGKKSKT